MQEVPKKKHQVIGRIHGHHSLTPEVPKRIPQTIGRIHGHQGLAQEVPKRRHQVIGGIHGHHSLVPEVPRRRPQATVSSPGHVLFGSGRWGTYRMRGGCWRWVVIVYMIVVCPRMYREYTIQYSTVLYNTMQTLLLPKGNSISGNKRITNVRREI